MKIQLRDGLPFVGVVLTHQGKQLTLQHVLLDTGSAGTLFATDLLASINIRLERQDVVREIRGVGGAEFVFTKQIDSLAVGKLRLDNFPIEVGAMDYGFAIEGILGMDFLLQTKAKVISNNEDTNQFPRSLRADWGRYLDPLSPNGERVRGR